MRARILAVALLLVACELEAQGQRRCTGDLSPFAADSTVPVYRDCDVDRVARLLGARPKVELDLSSAPDVNEGCYAVELDFVVDAGGVVELKTVRTRRSELRLLEDAFIALLPSLRFTPAEKAGRPVRQLVRYRHTYEFATFATGRAGSEVQTIQTRGRACR